jgi:hypothetical protein
MSNNEHSEMCIGGDRGPCNCAPAPVKDGETRMFCPNCGEEFADHDGPNPHLKDPKSRYVSYTCASPAPVEIPEPKRWFCKPCFKQQRFCEHVDAELKELATIRSKQSPEGLADALLREGIGTAVFATRSDESARNQLICILNDYFNGEGK